GFCIAFIDDVLVAGLQGREFVEKLGDFAAVGVGLDWLLKLPAGFVFFQEYVLAVVSDLQSLGVEAAEASQVGIAQILQRNKNVLEFRVPNLEDLIVVFEFGVAILFDNRLRLWRLGRAERRRWLCHRPPFFMRLLADQKRHGLAITFRHLDRLLGFL